MPAELFAAAQGRKAKNKGVHISRQRAAKRLLSGLLRCAACGGGMSTKGADKTGRIRIRCSTATESGTCPDPQTFYIDDIESRVLSALRAEMKSPAAIAEYVKTYTEERQRLAVRQVKRRATTERKIGELRRALDRLVDDIAMGRVDAAIFGPKATALDQERKRLESELATADAPNIALHPGVLADYERKLDRLQAAIEQDIRDGEPAHAQAIRDLVECVTVRHKTGSPGNVEIEITGRLNSLLGDKAFPNNVGRIGGSGGPLPSIPPTGLARFHTPP